MDIESLVEKLGVESLSARDQWGYTPAHWAALDGNVEVMRYLVERSVPVDLPCLGTQGPRPIHWACRKGHVAVVQVLLQVSIWKAFTRADGCTICHFHAEKLCLEKIS